MTNRTKKFETALTMKHKCHSRLQNCKELKKRRCHEYKCVLGKKICKSFWHFKM